MQINVANTARSTHFGSGSFRWGHFAGIELLPAANLLETWIQRARQRRHLGALSAERLADIGVTAEAAVEEASKPFWRK